MRFKVCIQMNLMRPILRLTSLSRMILIWKHTIVKAIFACTAWSAKHLFCWDLKSLSKSFSLTKSVRGNNLNNSPDIKVSLQNWEAVICVLPFLCSFTTSVFFRLRPLRWTSADLWDLNRFVFQEGYVVIGPSQCFLSKTRSLEKQSCHPNVRNIYNIYNLLPYYWLIGTSKICLSAVLSTFSESWNSIYTHWPKCHKVGYNITIFNFKLIKGCFYFTTPIRRGWLH